MSQKTQKLALKDLPWPISKLLNRDEKEGTERVPSPIPLGRIPRTWEDKGFSEVDQVHLNSQNRLPFSQSKIVSGSKTEVESIQCTISSRAISNLPFCKNNGQIRIPQQAEKYLEETQVLEGVSKKTLDDQLLEIAKEAVDFAVAESHVWVSCVETLDLTNLNEENGKTTRTTVTSQTSLEDSSIAPSDLNNIEVSEVSQNQCDNRELVEIQQTPSKMHVESSENVHLPDMNSPESRNWINQETQTTSNNNNTTEVYVQTTFLQFGRRSISSQDLTFHKKDIYQFLSNNSKPLDVGNSEPLNNLIWSNDVVDLDPVVVETYFDAVERASLTSTVQMPEAVDEPSPQESELPEASSESMCNNLVGMLTPGSYRRNQFCNSLHSSVSNLDFDITTQGMPSTDLLLGAIVVAYSSLPNILTPNSGGTNETSGTGPESDSNSSEGSRASSDGSSGYVADDERSSSSMEDASETEMLHDVSSADS